MSTPNRRYSTGMEILDRRLDGGLPIGTLVSFSAPAWSQSELILEQLGREQPVLFVSTVCGDEDELAARFSGPHDVGNVTVASTDAETLLADPTPILERVTPECYVVVDPVDPLEAGDRDAYLAFLDALHARLREQDSVGILHSLEPDAGPPGRRYTQKRADFCWRLTVLDTGREIKARLLVTKARGHRTLSEPLPLVLTDQVRIDTSRSIV